MGLLEEEFWWMPALGRPIEGGVRVAIDEGGPRTPHWPPEHEAKSLDQLPDWVHARGHTNVFRSVVVVSRSEGVPPVYGPLLVDVDIDGLEDGVQPSDSQMESACNTTLSVCENYLANGLPADHLRMFFSGHKGFHLEVVFVKGTVDFHWSGNDWGQRRELKRLRGIVRQHGVVIDPPRDYMRINGTINEWPDGSRRYRMIQLKEEELRSLSPADLWNRSKVD